MKLLLLLDHGAGAIFEDDQISDSPIFPVEVAVTENLAEDLFVLNVERPLCLM